MKKITHKIWAYASIFLFESISFNIALIFAIVTLVTDKSINKWSITSITFASLWLIQILVKHLIWNKMQKKERGLFLAIRKHGNKIVELTNNELNKSGQSDIREFLTDVDSNVEIGMLINGTATLINIFVGTKWFINAIKWHKSIHVFKYKISE